MSQTIRVRACLAVIHDSRILLVPHYDTDEGPVQWSIPGGTVAYGESLARRPGGSSGRRRASRPVSPGCWTSAKRSAPRSPGIASPSPFRGTVTGSETRPEAGHRCGAKVPRWFSLAEIETVRYHPREAVRKALAILASRRTL